MTKYTTSRLKRHGAHSMHLVSGVTRSMLRVAKNPSPNLSRDGMKRLKWFDHYEAHGRNASFTCRHFGISRPTFYRWRGRYDPRHLGTLEDRPSVPKRRRSPSWGVEDVVAVKELRERYPCWGKDKLVVLLGREKRALSTSMVGRILKHLKATRQLVEPLRGRISARKRTLKREYGVRKPKGYEIKEPGDMVQVDTLDVRPVPGVDLKHFTARDVVSKWDVVGLRGRATARTASVLPRKDG